MLHQHLSFHGRKAAAVALLLCVISLPVSVRSRVPLDPSGLYGSDQQAQSCMVMAWYACQQALSTTSVGASWLRLIWHDCGTYWTSTDDGGCNGSILREMNVTGGPQLGLEPSVDLTPTIVAQLRQSGCSGQSVADTIVVCAAATVSFFGGPTCPLWMGRQDSPDNTTDNPFRLPTPCMSDPQLVLNQFIGAGFRDPVASASVLAVGGHDIGVAHVGHICITTDDTTVANPGPMSSTPTKFDGQYYNDVLEGRGFFDSDRGYLKNASMNAYIQRFGSSHDQFLNLWCDHFQELSLLGVDPGGRPINGGWMPDGSQGMQTVNVPPAPPPSPDAPPPSDGGYASPPPPMDQGNLRR